MPLRDQIIKLAQEKPEFRKYLVPILKEAHSYQDTPPSWKVPRYLKIDGKPGFITMEVKLHTGRVSPEEMSALGLKHKTHYLRLITARGKRIDAYLYNDGTLSVSIARGKETQVSWEEDKNPKKKLTPEMEKEYTYNTYVR
jgi:hypothetical protein